MDAGCHVIIHTLLPRPWYYQQFFMWNLLLLSLLLSNMSCNNAAIATGNLSYHLVLCHRATFSRIKFSCWLVTKSFSLLYHSWSQDCSKDFHVFLCSVSLCRCLSVCRRWHLLAGDPLLWRQLCSRPKWRLSRAAEQKQLLRFLSSDGRINVSWSAVCYCMEVL